MSLNSKVSTCSRQPQPAKFYNNAICAFTGYQCSLPPLETSEYCIRHVLEGKTTTFQPCSYIYPDSSKRCLHAAPVIDRKESYCAEHSIQVLQKHQKSILKPKPTESLETCVQELSHHNITSLSLLHSGLPDPSDVPSVASNALLYNSDEDDNGILSDLDPRFLPRAEDDSELDSAESDADLLEHAGVFTSEEASRIYLEKLKKLRLLYEGEFKRLHYILKENKREYLQALKAEKETFMSINSQPKENASEMEAYQELKFLARYHRPLGREALLQKQLMERRAQGTERVPLVKSGSARNLNCIYSEGSWRCELKSIPLSKYCFKHIMHDERQVLFRVCGVVQGAGDKCEVPVVAVPHTATCVYHTPLPNMIKVSAAPKAESPSRSEGAQPKIIDLTDSSAFIVSETPPEHVMEGDEPAAGVS